MGQPSKRHRPSRPNSPLRPQNKNKNKKTAHFHSSPPKAQAFTQRETPQSIPNPDTAPPQGSPHSQLTQPSQQSSTPALAFKPPQHGAGLRCARAAVGRRALGEARKRPERRRGCCGGLGRDPCWKVLFLPPFWGWEGADVGCIQVAAPHALPTSVTASLGQPRGLREGTGWGGRLKGAGGRRSGC